MRDEGGNAAVKKEKPDPYSGQMECCVSGHESRISAMKRDLPVFTLTYLLRMPEFLFGEVQHFGRSRFGINIMFRRQHSYETDM